MKRSFLLLVLCWSFSVLFASESEFTAEYVSFDRHDAVLYRPLQKSPKSSIGIIVMHSDENYMGFVANKELAARGYTVLATIPSKGQILENKLKDIRACVEYLHRLSYISKVVLLGHSGGATVMTAYQLMAEQGRKALDGKLYGDYSDAVNNLPPADGVLLLDANYGLSMMTLMSLDPDISDESSGYTESELYNLVKAEGYNPTGSSDFSQKFEFDFTHAQQQRFSRLISSAEQRLALLKKGNAHFCDDEVFVVPGGNLMRLYNKLFPQDLRLLSHTKGVWPLIKNDGSIIVDTVYSVRAPMKAGMESEMLSSALVTTVRGFLSSVALLVDSDFRILEDGFKGVHWNSNLSTPIGNVSGITVPILTMGMTGSWEYLAAEYIYHNSASTDKSIAFVEGASHMFVPAEDAERYRECSYGNALKNTFDYVDMWLSKEGRFL